MKKMLALFHGLPLILYIGLGLWAYGKYQDIMARHRAEDERLLASTILAFHEINAEVARLQAELSRRQQVVVKYVERADKEKEVRDSALATAPTIVPAACSPWVTATNACARESALLRHAIDTLTADLDTARTTLAKADTVVATGTNALKPKRCRFPCIDFVVVAGGGLGADLKFHKGIFAGIKVF